MLFEIPHWIDWNKFGWCRKKQVLHNTEHENITCQRYDYWIGPMIWLQSRGFLEMKSRRQWHIDNRPICCKTPKTTHMLSKPWPFYTQITCWRLVVVTNCDWKPTHIYNNISNVFETINTSKRTPLQVNKMKRKEFAIYKFNIDSFIINIDPKTKIYVTQMQKQTVFHCFTSSWYPCPPRQYF